MYSTVFVMSMLVVINVHCRRGEDDDRNGLVREYWSHVEGDSLQDLLSDPRFPHKPTDVSIIKSFQSPWSHEKEQKSAQRIKGYFIPPEDGDYKFFSSCDGACEVFLSLDGSKGENNRIISQHRSTKRNQFEKYAEQASDAVMLGKDTMYYMEAINKQGTGVDHLSVGVELPSGKKMFPIPSNLLRTQKDENVIGEKRSNPVLDVEGKKYTDKDAIEPGINIFQDSQTKDDSTEFLDRETGSSPATQKKKIHLSNHVTSSNTKRHARISTTDHVVENIQAKPTTRQGIGLDLGHGGLIGGPIEGHAPAIMTSHPAPIDPHVVSPVGLNVAGTQGTATPLRHTGKVALIPAILHKTEPHYDHETGHFTPGESHVEPLIPAHDTANHFPHDTGHHGYDGHIELSHAASFPVMDTHHGFGGANMVDGPHVMNGHGGGGMEHGFSMMEEPHAINMDHHGEADHQYGMMHHVPELHAPIYDHHDGHHDGHMPLIVHPHVDHPPPPPPPPPKKPDVVKVEFVPQESGIKIAGKPVKAAKKAGTVRVQFIPGDNSNYNAQQVSARNSAAITGSARDKDKSTETNESNEKEASKENTKESTETIPTNILTSKLKEKLEGHETPEPKEEPASEQQSQLPINTIATPSMLTMDKTGNLQNYASTTAERVATEPAIQYVPLAPPKSLNGYEANPLLPSMGRNSAPTSGAGNTISSAEQTRTREGVNAGANNGGLAGAGANSYEEKIDPPFTALGQKYPEAVTTEEKDAAVSQSRQGPGQERVFFGAGSTPAHTTTGVQSDNIEQPDPNPTHNAPTDISSPNGQVISPVAGHLVDSLQDNSVSPEEALQMMNDFVSGNQDMSKAARNIEGMLGQIKHQHHPMIEDGGMTPQIHPPSDVVMPENDDTHRFMSSQDDESHRFIQNPNDVNPELQTGFTNPSFSKELDNSMVSSSDVEKANRAPEHVPIGEIPSPGIGYGNEAPQRVDYDATQRDQPHHPEPDYRNEFHLPESRGDVMERLNRLSPNEPPPTVDVFEGEGGKPFRGTPQQQPPIQRAATSDPMVVEQVREQNDGFANPVFNAGVQMHKMIPDVPTGSRAVGNFLDKIDPHEEPGVADPSLGFTPSREPNFSPGEEPLRARAPMDVTPSSRGLRPSPFSSNLASFHANPISESLGDSPLGMFGGELTSMGYDMGGRGRTFPSRRVGTSERQTNAHLKSFFESYKPKQRNLPKTGEKKDSVLAALYADSIFPEDNMDIKSLQGSLQGKTLSNYDRRDELGGSLNYAAAVRSKVPSRPLFKRRITATKIPNSSHHHKKKLRLKNKIRTTRTKMVNKSNNKKHVTVKRRNRRSLEDDGVEKSVKRIYTYRKGKVVKSLTPSGGRQRFVTERESPSATHSYIPVSRSLHRTKTMEPTTTSTMDWADISPMVNKELNKKSHQKERNKKVQHVKQSSGLKTNSNKEPQPQLISQEHASLRRLMGELKDVIRNLKSHSSKHESAQSSPVVTLESAPQQHKLLEEPSINEKSLTEDDIFRYESVTRGDIINAFASVNDLRKEKTRRPDSMDIEGYYQDVYEPGASADYKRTILQAQNPKTKRKLFNEELTTR